MEAKVSDQAAELASKTEEIDKLNKQVEEDRKVSGSFMCRSICKLQALTKTLRENKTEKSAFSP